MAKIAIIVISILVTSDETVYQAISDRVQYESTTTLRRTRICVTEDFVCIDSFCRELTSCIVETKIGYYATTTHGYIVITKSIFYIEDKKILYTFYIIISNLDNVNFKTK